MSTFIKKMLIIFLTGLFYGVSLADPIKIGVAGPFSGNYVAAGDQQWLGATQAADDINAEGGINGRKLLLISVDDDCNAKKAEKIATVFIQAGQVQAVIGHNCSAATLPASKLYGKAKLLMITPASTNPDITENHYHSIFRTCGRDDAQSTIAADFIIHHLNAKRIAIISDGSVYGKGLSLNMKNALNHLGVQAIFSREIKGDTRDYTEPLQQISAFKPDLVYFAGLQIDGGILLKQLRDDGNNTPFFGGDGIASPDFVQAAGGPSTVQDVYMTFFKDPLSIAEAKKVIKKFQEKGINPTGYTLNAYAAVQAVAEALKNSHNTDMSDWLHQHKVNSVIGSLEWDQKGDLIEAPFIVYKWDDAGEYQPYWVPPKS